MNEEPAGAALSRQVLVRMATFYLARHAASTLHLRAVLDRKIRRRCEARGLSVPDEAAIGTMIDETVAHLGALGLLDDEAYARGRARSLAAKGWPAWRIRTDLRHQDIDLDAGGLAEDTALDDLAQARRFAMRKRIGPFRVGQGAASRDKDIARLARAGFPVEVARAVVDGEAE